MITPADRRVHARWLGVEIVRYDRAGKWYVEYTDDASRIMVSVREAALLARETTHACVYLGLRGGRVFDRIASWRIP